MGKITAFFTSIIMTCAIFFQCLFGIGGIGFGKVVLVLEKDSYPVGTEGVEATLYNCTCEPIATGGDFVLEKSEDGKWVVIEPKEPYLVEDVFLLQPFEKAEKTFDLTRYDPLTPGRYRIQASAYAEFDLKQ